MPALSLGDEFGALVVQGAGVRIELSASGGVTIYSDGDVRLRPAINDDARPQAKASPQVGDRMEDGTIYAGTSPDTGRPMYTTPADAPLTMKWRQAMDYAAGLESHGHKDWRLPSKAELNELFNNRAAIGGFQDGWYWSSSEYHHFGATLHRFSDGYQLKDYGNHSLLVRCVRR